MSQRVPRFSARCRLPQLVAYAKRVAADRADTAALAALPVLLLAAALTR